MKYKQMNTKNKEEEMMEIKSNVETEDMTVGMAWVKVWLRWKEIGNKQREPEKNYKKERRKAGREWE